MIWNSLKKIVTRHYAPLISSKSLLIAESMVPIILKMNWYFGHQFTKLVLPSKVFQNRKKEFHENGFWNMDLRLT